MPVGATPVPDRREVSERLVRASGAVAGIPVEPGRYLRRGDPVDPAGSKRGQELTAEIDPEDLQRRWPVGAYLRGHERLGEFLEGQLDRRSRWLSRSSVAQRRAGLIERQLFHPPERDAPGLAVRAFPGHPGDGARGLNPHRITWKLHLFFI